MSAFLCPQARNVCLLAKYGNMYVDKDKEKKCAEQVISFTVPATVAAFYL
jgi:hypothetical protein